MMNLMSDKAAKVAKDLEEACDIARRAWLFSGQQAYGPLWETLTPEGRKKELARERDLKQKYDHARGLLVKTAPSLLNVLRHDVDYITACINLEIALDVAGVPYLPDNHMRVMPRPCLNGENETRAYALSKCIKNAPDCPNPGWPIPCPACNFCRQNPADFEYENAQENTDGPYGG